MYSLYTRLLQWGRALLCALFCLISLNIYATDLQKVPCSLSVQNKSLDEVFELIEKQTHYSIVCMDQSGLMKRKVTVNAPNASLEKVLQILSGQLVFQYKCLDNNIIIRTNENEVAPVEKIVAGKVTDDKKQALPGVSIMVKGTNRGTISNDNGDFRIKANEGDVLTFTFTGYVVYQLTVSKADNYTISLQEDQKKLSEVVVTALGIKKDKAKLGYAAQEVKGADLVKAREPNVMSSLTGKVAGLVIRNSTDMLADPGLALRGRKPLIVIDGIPDQTADLYKINGDDVESMTVLKGATASALYGSIGENGAIMITTKRGSGKDLSIDFNSSTQFQTSFIRIPKVQDTYGAGDGGKYAYVDSNGGALEGGGWIWGPKLNRPDPTTPSGYFETTQLISPIDPNTGERQKLPFLRRGKDNVKNFFRTGIVSSNNISISKSNDKGSFRASASHIYQQGITPNADLKNTSFNIAGNYNLSDAFNINARISYNKIYTENFPETGYGPFNYLYNLILWTGPDVDIRDLRNYWAPGQVGTQQRHINTSYYNNPYFEAYEILRGYDKNNTFGSVDMNYKISPSFSAKFRTGVNQYNLRRDYKDPKSLIRYGDKSRGQYTITNNNLFDIVSDLIVDYNHTFNSNFKIHAQGGASNYYRTYTADSSITDGLTIPGFYNLGNSTKPVTSTNTLEQRRTFSWYGIVDVELYNAFYITLTGRQDKISTLPLQNNTFFYPSLAGSAIVSELLKLPDWFTFLKARASLSRVSSGKLLSDYTYDYLPSYTKSTTWDGTQSFKYGDIIYSSDLKPQTSDAWEAGVDAKFFSNRLGFELTYFQTKDFNNIERVPVPAASGFNYRLENANVYQRRGFEAVITGNPVKSKDFRWDVMLNLSTYRRYLKKITTGAERLNSLKEGDRADLLFTNVYQTDGRGNVVYEGGMPKADDFRRAVGYSDPDWMYGLQNTFTYKNVSLGFLVDGRIGGSIYSTTNQKMWWGGTHPGTVNHYRDEANAPDPNDRASQGKDTYVANGVIVTGGAITYDKNGDVTGDTRTFAPNTMPVNYITYNRTTSNNANTNYNYYSQTFLKLREVTLTWRVPGQWLKKSFFRSADVSAVGRNLLLFSKMPNVDPDSGSDNLQTPSTRSMGFNVNLKF